MSSTYRYQIPVEQTKWKFEGKTETNFTWEYEDGREKLLNLYDKGKKQQRDTATRVDWSQDLDPDNPMMMTGPCRSGARRSGTGSPRRDWLIVFDTWRRSDGT